MVGIWGWANISKRCMQTSAVAHSMSVLVVWYRCKRMSTSTLSSKSNAVRVVASKMKAEGREVTNSLGFV